MDKREIENARIEALRQQFLQPTQEEVNANLGRALSERPVEVLSNFQAMTRKEIIQDMKPQLTAGAKQYLSELPEFKEVLALPSVSKAINEYISGQLDLHGRVTEDELKNVADHFTSVYKESRQIKTDLSKAQEKLTQVETKSSSGETVYIDPKKKYNEMMNLSNKGGRGRQEFLKWSRSEEGRQVIQAMYENKE